jgi:chromosome segregation ATPase
MATQTAEERIHELESEVRDLEQKNQEIGKENIELEKENASLEKEKDALEEMVFELQERVRDLDSSELVTVVELYADPHNWTPDGKFSPLMKHIAADDPYDPASRALNAYHGG